MRPPGRPVRRLGHQHPRAATRTGMAATANATHHAPEHWAPPWAPARVRRACAKPARAAARRIIADEVAMMDAPEHTGTDGEPWDDRRCGVCGAWDDPACALGC